MENRTDPYHSKSQHVIWLRPLVLYHHNILFLIHRKLLLYAHHRKEIFENFPPEEETERLKSKKSNETPNFFLSPNDSKLPKKGCTGGDSENPSESNLSFRTFTTTTSSDKQEDSVLGQVFVFHVLPRVSIIIHCPQKDLFNDLVNVILMSRTAGSELVDNDNKLSLAVPL